MKIAGIEKTTLIDYPNKIACTIFLYGCNFRCKFCHNPELVTLPLKKEIYSEEILNYLKKRKNQLEGVCITGGEPFLTLRKNFLKKIKKIGYEIKVDTNGSFPEKLKEFIDDKLIDFIAMDIKADKRKYFQLINSATDLNKIEKSIKIITNSGIDYEFRTTIIEDFHSIEDMKKMAEWIVEISGKRAKKICLQGFKNQGKILDENFANKKNTSEKHLRKIKEEIKEFFEEIEIRN
jgi:pyruvate formate lyase activating enzyme